MGFSCTQPPCPPMPGGGMNITVSIDLGSMLGGRPPMPPCPPPECEDEGTIYFNEGSKPKPKGGFGSIKDFICGGMPMECPTENKPVTKPIPDDTSQDDTEDEEAEGEKKGQPKKGRPF